MADFVGQEIVHLDVRPKRAGFLFASGSSSQFRLAVERACSRWGGMTEPIIPVSPGGRIQPAWVQIAEILEPDVVFDAAGLDLAARVKASQTLGVDVRPFDHENNPWHGAHPLVVDHATGPVFTTPAARPALVAGPGVFPSWDDVENWRQAGLDVVTSDDDVASALHQLSGRTIIERTAEQCGESSTSGMLAGFALIWIARPGSLKDALWFWNMRALMPVGYSKAAAALITERAASDRRVLEALDNLKGRQKWTTPDAVIVGLEFQHPALRTIASTLGFDTDVRKFSHHLGRERDPTEPLSAAVQADPRRYLLGARTNGLRDTGLHLIRRPTTTVRRASPVTWGRSGVGGHVIARWSAPFMQVPRREPVARLFHPNGRWSQGGLEIETDPSPLYHFDVAVPDGMSVLGAAIRAAGLRFEWSHAGQLAAAVQARMRTDDRLIADPQVRAVITALTTPRSKTLAALIAAEASDVTAEAATLLAERIGFRLAQVALPPLDVASRASLKVAVVAPVLERLVSLGLAERGLRVECDRCGMQPFVSLRSSERRAGRCTACHASAAYATTDGGELQIHYRLNALLDRASDQGVLPHLAVFELLGPSPESSCFVLGAHVHADARHLGEVDLLGFDGEQLVCGEVKTSPGGFTDHDIKKTVNIASRMRADAIVFGCTEHLPDELTDQLFAAAPNGMAVRVVDGDRVRLAPLPVPAPALPMT